MVGAWGIAAIFGTNAYITHGAGITRFGTMLSLEAAIAEAIGTFILAFTVAGIALDQRAPAGWAGRPVAVCGEMAGDPRLGALLVGLGVTELSMSAPLIPAMKTRLASYRYVALRRWADQTLALTTVEDVHALINAGLPNEATS